MRPRTSFYLACAAMAALATGCTPAPRAAAPRGTADAPGGAGFTPALKAGPVHLTDYTTDDGPDSVIVLSGAVGDFGTARSVHPDGSVDPEHGSQLDLRLTHGSFRLDIAALDRAFVEAAAGLAVNTDTCSGTAGAEAAVPIVPGSGTGAYRGIAGTFELTATLDEVYRPTGCDESSAFLSQVIVITGTGTITAG